MLLLSLRYSTNDHLWFTFFHEAAHLLLHGKKLQFVEGLDELDEEAEAEADRFACDWLISPADARRLEARCLTETGAVLDQFAIVKEPLPAAVGPG